MQRAAWISARAGRAVIQEDETFYVVDVESPLRRYPRALLHHLRGITDDYVKVDVTEGYPFDGVFKRLDQAWRKDRALTLLLITVDREASDRLRRQAAVLLEKLVEDPAVLTDLRERLDETPLPAVADVGAAPLGGRIAALLAQ